MSILLDSLRYNLKKALTNSLFFNFIINVYSYILFSCIILKYSEYFFIFQNHHLYLLIHFILILFIKNLAEYFKIEKHI